MKTIEITFNGEQQEVKFVAGLTKADFKHHNQLTASDMSEQADIMYTACLKAYAVKIQSFVSLMSPTKAGLKVVLKKGEFMTQANVQYEYGTKKDGSEDELVKDWAKKSMTDNIKRQEKAKSFLFKKTEPVTSNTSERRVEPIA